MKKKKTCLMVMAAMLLQFNVCAEETNTRIPSPETGQAQAIEKEANSEKLFAVVLPVVVVTAQKKEEDAFDVPAAITSLDSGRIEDLHIDDIADLSAVSPNVTIVDAGFSGSVSPVIRGFYTMNACGSATGIYLDGIYMGKFMSIPPILYDVERIEILKGPQGTLYGKNNMGGVINIISKPPVNEISGHISTKYGNFNNTITNGDISFPLINEKIFLKLGGYFKSFDGYFYNETLSRQTGGITAGAGNVAVKIKPSSSSEFDIKYEYWQKSEELYPFHSSPDMANKDPYTLYHNATGTHETIGHNGSFKSEFSIKNINIVNILGINKADSKFADMEMDYTASDIMLFGGENNDFSLNDELRIQTDMTDINLKWLLGLFVSYDDREQNLGAVYGKDSCSPYFPYATMEGNGFMDNYSLSTLTGSAFGELTYTLFNRLGLTAGLRCDYDTKKTEIQTMSSYMGETVFTGEKYNESADYQALSPKFAIAYNIDDIAKPFISVTRGYQAGGINTYSHISGKIKYDPEYSWNYEAGIKSRLFNQRLSVNANIFYAEWKDQQVNVYFGPTDYGIQNAALSVVYGVELETQALIADGLTIDASGGYNKSTLREFEITTYNFMTNQMEKKDLKGKSQAFTPLYTGLIGIQYAKEIMHSDKLSYKPIIRGELKYTGEQYYSVDNSMKNSGYALFNAHIGLGINNFEFMFWMKNILDKRYFQFAYDLTGMNSLDFCFFSIIVTP